MNDIAALQDVIRKMHGCESRHVESVEMAESFQGRTVWQGTVEVFDLIGHPKAKRCYAWTHEKDGGGLRSVAVLELPPVDSPKTAVQAAIVADTKRPERK